MGSGGCGRVESQAWSSITVATAEWTRGSSSGPEVVMVGEMMSNTPEVYSTCQACGLSLGWVKRFPLARHARGWSLALYRSPGPAQHTNTNHCTLCNRPPLNTRPARFVSSRFVPSHIHQLYSNHLISTTHTPSSQPPRSFPSSGWSRLTRPRSPSSFTHDHTAREDEGATRLPLQAGVQTRRE